MQFFTGKSTQGLAENLWKKNRAFISTVCLGLSLCTLFAVPGVWAKPGISSDSAAPRAVSSGNREDFEDMRVKVLGGDIRMTRRWTRNGWEWNSRWNSILTYDEYKAQLEGEEQEELEEVENEIRVGALRTLGKGRFRAGSGGGGGRFGLAGRTGIIPGQSCKLPYEYFLFRNGQSYRPNDFFYGSGCPVPEGDEYHAQLRLTLTKDGKNYTWKDRKGNLTYYEAGKLKYYQDRNSVRVTLEYTEDRVKYVKDHLGNTVITYHWKEIIDDVDGERISTYLLEKLEDYSGRVVTYHYGEDSSDNLNYRQLIAVTDMRGYDWTIQYKTLANDELTLDSITDPNGRVTRYSTNSDGDINGYVNADGVGTSYTHSYDSGNKTYKLTQRETSGVITETWHDASGMPIKKTIGGELQHEITYQYSGDNTASDYADQFKVSSKGASRGGSGRFSIADMEPVRLISSITTDARGLETKYYYDTFRNITRTEFADGSYTTTDWNTELTLPLRERDERGVITEYGYDSNGNLITFTEALGTPEQRTTRYTYDAYGQMITETTGEAVAGNTALATTTWDYDGYGNVIKITDPEEHSTEYRDYDSNGNATTIVDGRQNVWTRNYDTVGNLLADLNPYGQGYVYEYDATGHLTKLTDASGSQRSIVNNTSGLPLTATDDAGNQFRLDYDKGNRLTAIADPEGISISLEYNSQNQLDAIIDGEKNRTKYIYQDNLLSLIDYPTYKEELVYGKRNRIEQRKRSANNLEQLRTFGYDLDNNLSSGTDALKNTEKYEYDSLNRIVAIVDPINHEAKKTEFFYDARDNLLQVKDSESRQTLYSYDKNNRIISETKHDFVGIDKDRVYIYDNNGNLAELLSPQKEKRTFIYDNANRVIRLKVFAGKINVEPVKIVDYYYNEKAQYIGYLQYPGTDIANATADIVRHGETYTYDSLNRLMSVKVDYYGKGNQAESVVFSKSYSYSYYSNGQKKTYTNPEGLTYTYYYNSNNQLAAVHIPGEGQLVWTDFYWLAPQTLLLPGGNKITLNYDDFLRVKERVLLDSAGNDKAKAIYQYDLESNIRKIISEHGEYNFNYDGLYRLTEADYPIENYASDEKFSYDGVGNRIIHESLKDIDDEESYSATQSQSSYNNHNQLTSVAGDNSASLKYNDNGHTIQKFQGGITWNYSYNFEERLISVQKNGQTVGEYQYNPYGRRIYKQAESSTYFLYNEEGMAAEYDSMGNLIKEYHFRPGMPWMTEPLFHRVSSGEVYYYQNDHLGTPQRIIDNSGATVWEARYEAFGSAEISVEVVDNNLRFPGQYFDKESYLIQNLFRYFDPQAGRYISKDPVGLIGGLNNYIYVYANPINSFDPYGLWAWGDPLPQSWVDGAAGFGDTLSFGITDNIRDLMGTNGAVNKCSGAYAGGQLAGVGFSLAFGGAHFGRHAMNVGAKKFVSDPRKYPTVQKQWSKSVGGYKGKYELHHWFTPQSKNGTSAGWNLVPVTPSFNRRMSNGGILFNTFKGSLIGTYLGALGAVPTALSEQMTNQDECSPEEREDQAC
ncbi:RHS repeat-associated core domain-containing protein [Microbulbifer sp. ZKSA002]|uniref:RHS repeat-associated core domain-containing protein n=1 Tax=Microbulbifer sp. ZKSA002 TaxID=3243388 RepID=UPI00403958FE